MPLIKSKSKAAVSSNIREMIAAGHPRAQAVAAALDTQRRARRAPGGVVTHGHPGYEDMPREPDLPELYPSPMPTYNGDSLAEYLDTQKKQNRAQDEGAGRLPTTGEWTRRKLGFGDGGVADQQSEPRVPGPIDETGREVLFNNVGETPSGDYLSRVARDVRHGLGHLSNVGWDARGWGVGNLDLIMAALAAKRGIMPKHMLKRMDAAPRRPELGYGRKAGGSITTRVGGPDDYDEALANDPDALQNEQGYWVSQLPRYRGAQWENDTKWPDSAWEPWKKGEVEHYMPRTPHYQKPGPQNPPQRTRRSYGHGGPIGYAGGGWAGEMDEMGMTPSEVAPKAERPRSPVPEWLVRQTEGSRGQQGPGQPESGGAAGRVFANALGTVGSTAAELTGIPSILRGVNKVQDDDPSLLHKAAGVGEAALGVMPFARLPMSAIKTGMTVGGLGTLRELDNMGGWEGLVGKAQAQGSQWTPPTPAQKKNRSWVMQQQDELIKEGLYPKNDPTYGSYGNATEEGLQRLWKRKQDAERERVRQEKLELDRLGIERAKADAAKQEANTKAAGEKRKEKEGKEATDILTKADAARNEVSKAESPWIKYPRLIAPTLLGIGAGILSGGKMAKSSAAKGQENALTQQKAANRILSGSDPSVNEKIGKVNQFAQQGQQEPTKGWFGTQFGARPDKENWFVDNPSAKSAPHWMANPKAPQSSKLYPESRTGEHVRNAMLPGGIGGVEFGLGTGGDLYYSGQIADQEKIINDKLSTADAVRAAAANKSDYEWKKALSEFVQRTGATTALYGAGKGSHAIASRPPMRPNIAKADTWRGEINTAIGNARGKEALAAKAERDARKAEKAAREAATSPAAPSGGSAPRNRRRGPNGGGAAPLLPLASGPLLSGDRGTREPYPELTGGAALEDSYNDEGFGRPYATGGHVEAPVKRHHSFFQPRKIGRFAGGPVYEPPVKRQHHSNFQPRKIGRFSGGPIWPKINRFDGGQVDPLREAAEAATYGAGLGALGPAMARRHERDTNVGRFAKPGLADPLREAARGATSGAALGALGPGLQGLLDRRRKEMEAEAYKSLLDGGRGESQDMMNAPSQFKPGWRARGGATEGQSTPSVPHSAGPVEGRTGGRADALNMTVAQGSYVLPADIVSGLPGAEGNTGAGMALLAKQFGPAQRSAMGHGGVGIKISDGEFVIGPEKVAQIGGGDVSHGHRVLDAFVKRCRAHHITTLKSLPPPAQN